MDEGGQWRVNPLAVITEQPAKVGLAYVWLVLGILAHYVYGVLVPVAAGTTTSPDWGTRNQILARIAISFIVGAFVFTTHWGKDKGRFGYPSVHRLR